MAEPVDAACCVTMFVDVAKWPDLGDVWGSGPLPLALPHREDEGARQGSARVTDRDARSTMLSKRIQDVVLGPIDAPEQGRLHAFVPQPVGFGDWILDAVEVVRRPDLAGDTASRVPIVLIWHWTGRPQDVAESVYELVRSANGTSAVARSMTDVWDLIMGMGITIESSPRSIRTLAHIINPCRTQDPYSNERLWSLAAATPSRIALPSSTAGYRTIAPSADWRGLVLRDGVAFISAPNGVSEYEKFARVYCRTIYLDALVLASLQLEAATWLADNTQRLISGSPKLADLSLARRSMLKFRGTLWWAHVSDRASIVDQIVSDFQEQHNLPALVDQVTQDLNDITAYLESELLVVTAEREKMMQRNSDKLAARFGIFATVLIVPSLVIGFTQLAVGPSWVTFGVSFLISLASTLAVALAIRAMIRAQSEKVFPSSRRDRRER